MLAFIPLAGYLCPTLFAANSHPGSWNSLLRVPESDGFEGAKQGAKSRKISVEILLSTLLKQ